MRRSTHALEFHDPKRLLDRAASEGYVAVTFEDAKEALRFAKRVRRTIQNGQQQVLAKRQERKTLKADEYVGAEEWEPLYVHSVGPKVEIINVKHPKGATHLPQFKITGA